MPSRSGNIARVTVGLLNRVSDEVIGATSQNLGPGSGKYALQLGTDIELSDADALLMSDTAIGTLYGGVYRYVKFRAADTAASYKRGAVLFVDSAAAGQVTNSAVLATAVGVAGIQINPSTGQYAIVPGRYGWIYVGGGKVGVLNKSALTAAAAVGNQMLSAGDGTVDNLLIATASPTGAYLGQAETLPVAGSITTIWMPSVRRRIIT